MSDVNYMDLNEFKDQGWLQELNREWAHPRGIALSMEQDEDGNWSWAGVWDYRDDPEGMAFSSATLSEERAVAPREAFEAHEQTRQERFGWVIQPLVGDDPLEA